MQQQVRSVETWKLGSRVPTGRPSLRPGLGDPETRVAQPDTGVRWSCVHAGILEYIPYFWSGPTAQTV